MCLPLADGLDTVILEAVAICQTDIHSPSWSIMLQVQFGMAGSDQVQDLRKEIIVTWVEGIVAVLNA